jgi:hypothetical protein
MTGKRAGGNAVCERPTAKARTLAAAFDRARNQTPRSPFLEFEEWRPRVIAESRAYYAQRSEGWMKQLWETVKSLSEHSVAEEFFEETRPIPLDKTRWVHNPKETSEKFDSFLSTRAKTVEASKPEASPADAPAVSETATTGAAGGSRLLILN